MPTNWFIEGDNASLFMQNPRKRTNIRDRLNSEEEDNGVHPPYGVGNMYIDPATDELFIAVAPELLMSYDYEGYAYYAPARDGLRKSEIEVGDAVITWSITTKKLDDDFRLARHDEYAALEKRVKASLEAMEAFDDD